MKRNIILISIYFILGLICALINFSIPTYPFADNDTAGYLAPALSLYEDMGLTHESARSFLYPLFVSGCLFVFGSFKGIVILQTGTFIFSLFTCVQAWHSLSLFAATKFRSLLLDSLGILLFFAIGFCYVFVYFNHSIRPESLFVSALLLLMAACMRLFMRKVKGSGSFSLPVYAFWVFANFCLIVFYPRWALAGGIVFIFLIVEVYKRNHSKWPAKLATLMVPSVLFLFSVWIPEQALISKNDAYGNLFVKRQFYYAHYNLIENDVNEQLEISYHAKGENASVNKELDKQFFTVLGYNPDVLMYGETCHKIEANLAYDIQRLDSFYSGKSTQIIVKHIPGYAKKVIRQFSSFYTMSNSVHTIPRMYQLNIQQEFKNSYTALSSMSATFGKNKPLLDYLEFTKTFRSYSEPPFFAFSYLVLPFHALFKIMFGVFFAGFMFAFFWVKCGRIKFALPQTLMHYQLSIVSFTLLVCMLIPPAMLHTFDMVRYWMCFLPLSFFFCINFILFVSSIPAVETEGKILHWINIRMLNRKLLASAVFFLLVLQAVQTLYYSGQYHFFDPFVQNAPIRYTTEPKDTNEIRILMLGGSTTANLHLPEEQRYPYLLEQKLQEQYPEKKIRVINAANDWYSTRHSLINYASYYYQYEPDMVIIMHAINDLYRSFSPRHFAYGGYDSLYTHFYGPCMRGVDPPTFARYITEMSFFGNLPDRFTTFNQVDYPLSAFKSIYAFDKNLRRLVDICKTDGAQVFIVTQPNLYMAQMPDSLSAKCWFHQQFCNRKISNFNYEYPTLQSMNRSMEAFNAIAMKISQEKNITCIPAADTMPKAASLFVDDVHYTYKGCNFMAEIVKEAILNSWQIHADSIRVPQRVKQ